MDRNDLVTPLVARVLGIPPQGIRDDLIYGGIPEWDSLNHVNLMVALEGALSTTIDEDLMMELTSIKSIREFVARQPGKASG